MARSTLKASFVATALLASLPSPVSGWENGLARTPAMGWNPFNTYLCDTTEANYRAQAQALVRLGLDKLGYQYLTLDCGWQGTSRNSTGHFTHNTALLPSGIPALSSFIHSLGLKFGLYSGAGYYSCDMVGGSAKWLASLNFETQDAQTFANWGADYLKYDNCYAVSPTDFVNYNPPIRLEPNFVKMRDAIAATRRPIVYAICQWGIQDPARWAGNAGNSWRISNDISDGWAHIVRIINQVVPSTGFSKPGAWNDLDMLEVGNAGLTPAEWQTHFAFWAAVKSPLMLGNDLTRVNGTALSIIANPRIIALNQDPLGAAIGLRRRYTNDRDIWAGPLADGTTVALVINWQNSQRSMTFDLPDVGFSAANAVDLITGNNLGRLTNTYTANVPAHGCFVLKLSNTVAAPRPAFTTYGVASATLGGSATRRTVNSTIPVVGNVGNGGTLTFNNLNGGSSGGTKLVSFDYINAQVDFSNTACSNCRVASISVNGGAASQVQFPLSSNESWDISYNGYTVLLAGFRAGTSNTLTISGPSGWAPDFVRIAVAV